MTYMINGSNNFGLMHYGAQLNPLPNSTPILSTPYQPKMDNLDMWKWLARRSSSLILDSASKSVSSIQKSLQTNPDLTSILLLLLILYVSLLILTHATKMIYAMVKTFVRAMIFLLILAAIVWAATRGVGGMYSDAMVWLDSSSTSSTIQSNWYQVKKNWF